MYDTFISVFFAGYFIVSSRRNLTYYVREMATISESLNCNLATLWLELCARNMQGGPSVRCDPRHAIDTGVTTLQLKFHNQNLTRKQVPPATYLCVLIWEGYPFASSRNSACEGNADWKERRTELSEAGVAGAISFGQVDVNDTGNLPAADYEKNDAASLTHTRRT